MKKTLSLILALAMVVAFASCGSAPAKEENTEVTVFAAASLTESLDAIAQQYKEVAPNVTLVFNYDSSGTLLTQINEGAECDLFLSAAQKQMDELEANGGIDTASRLDLLENKVVLCISPGNPANITNFDDMIDRLKDGKLRMAIGNEDVPVGQYTRKIFDYYGLNMDDIAPCLTEGSNVKEVTVAVAAASVDCGIIYATDAFSAGLNAVDMATPEMCGQVIYPAAVLENSTHKDEAQAFLDYLASDAAAEAFEGVGFTKLS